MSFIIFFTTNYSHADITNLVKGIVVNDSTLNELTTTTTPNAFSYGISWLSQKSVGGGTVDAFLKIQNSTDLYSFSSSRKLYHTNFDSRVLLGHWPLTRWSHQYVFPEDQKRHDDYYREYPYMEYFRGFNHPLGCLENTPLRYGDIDSDTQNEIVLFLGNDIIVFSPESKKIIFAETLHLNDWMTLEQTAQHIRYKEPAVPVTVQYLSSVLADTANFEAGYRGYSKLYLGDFNNNGTPDIIVWRKLYTSRLVSDPIKGFSKLNDTFQHYEKLSETNATGEYLPQTTDEATIKNWLTSNSKQLTWQKGYPNLSECAGQEGQLIPEMHDPLLNDPEVLQ